MKYLIFDLDGCLIDSSEVQKAAFLGAYREIVGDENCPTYEEYVKYTGDSIENVLDKLGLPISMAVPFRRISSGLVKKVKVNWEAINFIREVKKQGCKVAICTGKDHNRTVEILKYYNIYDLFDVLVCADDVFKPKPAPEPVIKALEQMQCTNEEAFVIGDGYNDLVSAKAAGVKSILTLWYGDYGVVRDADYVVRDVNELKELLDKEYYKIYAGRINDFKK